LKKNSSVLFSSIEVSGVNYLFEITVLKICSHKPSFHVPFWLSQNLVYLFYLIYVQARTEV